MRVLILIAVLFYTCPCFINAQVQWDYKDYQKITHKNFRSDQRVKQKFDKINPDIPLLNALLFFISNEIRTKNGIEPIKYHYACEIAAYNHSLKMVESGFFSHYNTKDKDRKSTDDRAKLAGITNPSIAENIAYIYLNYDGTYLEVAENFIDVWMNSPGHKANILSEKALQMGCGVYLDGDKAYATQVFQWFSEIKLSKAKDELPKLKNGETPEVIKDAIDEL